LFRVFTRPVYAVVDSMERTVLAVITCQVCSSSENAPESLLQLSQRSIRQEASIQIRWTASHGEPWSHSKGERVRLIPRVRIKYNMSCRQKCRSLSGSCGSNRKC